MGDSQEDEKIIYYISKDEYFGSFYSGNDCGRGGRYAHSGGCLQDEVD